MKYWLKVLLMLLAALAFATCTTKDKPTLRIGMNVEFPPFSSKVDGSYVGIDVDLAHKIAEKMEYPFKIIDMEFDTLIPAIRSGKIDFAISAMSITAERSRLIEFSQSYYQINQAVIAHQDSPILIQDIKDIAKYKIGVNHTTTAHHWVQKNLVMKNLVSIEQVILYPTNTEAIEDLVNGKIDLVINDDIVVRGFEPDYPITIKYSIETNESYGIAMPKDGEYNDQIKAALQDLIDSGEMRSILQTHISNGAY
jgi:polar amino acid transport system substrate-binding protein